MFATICVFTRKIDKKWQKLILSINPSKCAQNQQKFKICHNFLIFPTFLHWWAKKSKKLQKKLVKNNKKTDYFVFLAICVPFLSINARIWVKLKNHGNRFIFVGFARIFMGLCTKSFFAIFVQFCCKKTNSWQN